MGEVASGMGGPFLGVQLRVRRTPKITRPRTRPRMAIKSAEVPSRLVGLEISRVISLSSPSTGWDSESPWVRRRAS